MNNLNLHKTQASQINIPLKLRKTKGFVTINGYASLFNKLDHSNDIILPGAFTNSLKTRSTKNIKMLYYHDPKKPIGIWKTILENRKGLLVSGQILTNTQFGKELSEYIKIGAIDGLSIGFKTIKAKRYGKTNIRQILALDLWEISLVTFPMLIGAKISDLKNI